MRAASAAVLAQSLPAGGTSGVSQCFLDLNSSTFFDLIFSWRSAISVDDSIPLSFAHRSV
jgi:hypothetical protein